MGRDALSLAQGYFWFNKSDGDPTAEGVADAVAVEASVVADADGVGAFPVRALEAEVIADAALAASSFSTAADTVPFGLIGLFPKPGSTGILFSEAPFILALLRSRAERSCTIAGVPGTATR